MKNHALQAHLGGEAEAHEIEAWLERGLELYGQGRSAEAIVCWRRVIELSPGERRAADYLESAGVPLPGTAHRSGIMPAPGASAEPESPPVDRGALVLLLRERRYDDAISLLHEAQEQAPHDASLARGIALIEQHLERRQPTEPPTPDPPTPRREATPKPPPTLRSPPTSAPSPTPLAAEPPRALSLFDRATEAYLDGDYDGAVRLYQEHLVDHPGDVITLHNLGRLKGRVAGR